MKTAPNYRFIRFFSIFNLVIVFTFLSYLCLYPFMHERVEEKIRLGLTSTLISSPFFESVSEIDKNIILKADQDWKSKISDPISNKLLCFFELLVLKLPPFKRAWILFSIILSVMVLLQKEGVEFAIWILPLLVLFHSFDLMHREQKSNHPSHEALFPTEKELVLDYLNVSYPLNGSIMEQKGALEKGFDLYLIKNFTDQTPSEDPSLFDTQRQEGFFRFNLARVQAIYDAPPTNWQDSFSQKEPLWLLSLYFIWNLFYAFMHPRRV